MLPNRRLTLRGFSGVAVVALLSLVGVAQRTSPSGGMPVFEVDPAWPKLPNDWVVGIVSSVTVDSHDNVWIFQRPASVPDALKSRAAPPVVEFDKDGKFVTAWGGPGQGYDWPNTEHGIAVDYKDNVWITGSGNPGIPATQTEDFLVKFTPKGKFVMQIGAKGQSKGNADTKNVHLAADTFVYRKTNELFVADGYGNRRVIVFNPDTGDFKRMWGAFGNKPEDGPPTANVGGRGAVVPLDTEGPGSPQFANPVHAVKVSNDELVYVADRTNRRVQVFTLDGKFVKQVFINRAGPAAGSAAGLAFSPDRDQQFLYVADYGNSHLLVLNRKTLEVLYQFGVRSETPGNFRGPHHIAADSKGNIYVAEVSPGNRAQKFVLKGMSQTPPPNALTPAQLSPTPTPTQ